MRHLLGIKSLSKREIVHILDTATKFKSILDRPVKTVPSLKDVTIANLFFEPSTRTRLSFELAEKRLSADVVNFSPATSSLNKGESLLDTVRSIWHMKVDMVVVRHSSPGVPHFLSKKIAAKIVNAGDGSHEHPTQALLDAFSLQEKLGASLEGRRILILGDIMHSRVALSNILCLKKLGAEVKVCAPATLIPQHIGHFGVDVESSLVKALAWCEAVNVLRMQLERQKSAYFPSLEEYALHYGLNRKVLDALPNEVIVLHPGPMNRGVEIDGDVADSSQSIIFRQIENGVAIRMAVLYLLL